jgi:hypothetical protein
MLTLLISIGVCAKVSAAAVSQIAERPIWDSLRSTAAIFRGYLIDEGHFTQLEMLRVRREAHLVGRPDAEAQAERLIIEESIRGVVLGAVLEVRMGSRLTSFAPLFAALAENTLWSAEFVHADFLAKISELLPQLWESFRNTKSRVGEDIATSALVQRLLLPLDEMRSRSFRMLEGDCCRPDCRGRVTPGRQLICDYHISEGVPSITNEDWAELARLVNQTN